MVNKLAAVLLLFSAMLLLAVSGGAQQNAPYHISNCPSLATCCAVPAPMMTEPVPGGTPTVVPQSAVVIYGLHVSNTNAASEFLQLFNATAQPAAGTTPIGASSWVTPSAQDRDVNVGNYGMAFTLGAEACCSSTQGTFTAVGGCGFILQYY